MATLYKIKNNSFEKIHDGTVVEYVYVNIEFS